MAFTEDVHIYICTLVVKGKLSKNKNAPYN